MTNLTILLVEDNISFALEVEMLIGELGYLFAGVVNNANDAIAKINEHHPDLILMDIGIKGNINGLSLADLIRDKHIPIIFITQSRDTKTYEKAQTFRPLAYLVKPFDLFTLKSTIEQAARQSELLQTKNQVYKNTEANANDCFYIKHNSSLNKVLYKNILWIKSDGNYCTIHTTEKKYITKVSLLLMIKKLDGFNFLRVHKQYIVPLDRISNIDLFESTIQINEKSIPLGRSYKAKLVEQLDLI